MSNWETLPLGNVLTFQRGFDITKAEQSDGPYWVISSSGPKSTNEQFKVEGPGVIIGRKGSLGTVFYSGANYWPHDSTLWVKDFHGNNPKFAYYFLQTMGLERLDAGSSNPSLNRNHIHTISVLWPPLPIQHRIAGILSAYDDLIENSQRRIKILEEMARRLYCEWFVYFRFPGHEGCRLVQSPLGEIPEGWEVVNFGELYDTGSGGTPSRTHPEYYEDGTVDWVKSQELLDGFVLSTEERITEAALKKSSAKLFPANTVLIALYGATIGKLAILSCPAATNQACCAILPKHLAFGREFAFLSLLLNRERIIGMRLGAAQQNISQVLLRNFECLKPPIELLRLFSDQTAPFFDQTLALQYQIQNLRRTRDLLLPRLLSGQIDVEALPEPVAFAP